MCTVVWRARWLFLKKKPLDIVLSVYSHWRTAVVLPGGGLIRVACGGPLPMAQLGIAANLEDVR